MKKALCVIMSFLTIVGFSRIVFSKTDEEAEINIQEFLMYWEEYDVVLDPLISQIDTFVSISTKDHTEGEDGILGGINKIKNYILWLCNLLTIPIMIVITVFNAIIYPILIILNFMGIPVDPQFMKLQDRQEGT